MQISTYTRAARPLCAAALTAGVLTLVASPAYAEPHQNPGLHLGHDHEHDHSDSTGADDDSTGTQAPSVTITSPTSDGDDGDEDSGNEGSGNEGSDNEDGETDETGVPDPPDITVPAPDTGGSSGSGSDSGSGGDGGIDDGTVFQDPGEVITSPKKTPKAPTVDAPSGSGPAGRGPSNDNEPAAPNTKNKKKRTKAPKPSADHDDDKTAAVPVSNQSMTPPGPATVTAGQLAAAGGGVAGLIAVAGLAGVVTGRSSRIARNRVNAARDQFLAPLGH